MWKLCGMLAILIVHSTDAEIYSQIYCVIASFP